MSHSPIRWGYHRVSTVHGQSLELGRQEFIDAGIPADKIWSEQVSGKSKENRPELKAMLKALQPGIEINVCKLDRLARNVKDLLEIAEKIKKAGATLNILDLKIDTSSPVGELILTVIGAVAQLERSTIRIRTKAGIEAYRAKGGKMGPKPKPERDSRIQKKVKGGMSWEEVAKDEGVSRQTVYRVMHKDTAIEHRKNELMRKHEVKTPAAAKNLNEAKKMTTTEEVGD